MPKRPNRIAAPIAMVAVSLALAALPAGNEDPPPVPTAVDEASSHPCYLLHEREFAARFWVWDPNHDKWVGGRVSWATNESLLFYAFNRRNPEALLKITDGRGFNDDWWGDFAALSDLELHLTISNMETREYWKRPVGPRLTTWEPPASTDRRRVVCASPHYKGSEADGFQCVWGTGLSSREAWRDNGRRWFHQTLVNSLLACPRQPLVGFRHSRSAAVQFAERVRAEEAPTTGGGRT
ncbi:MAG: hypothetical protein OXF79_23680 [Chloroflexi bacterium]|nr:hypothetical protein [Chloroflexota bacterium]